MVTAHGLGAKAALSRMRHFNAHGSGGVAPLLAPPPATVFHASSVTSRHERRGKPTRARPYAE
jgi:hypothetical protein